MSPLAVVRVCHRTRVYATTNTFDGPFKGGTNYWPQDAGNTMPNVFKDGLVKRSEKWNEKWVFGFHDPAGLHYFSPEDRKKLSAFTIRHYLVPPGTFRMGREQVMFDPQTALCTHIEPL